MLKEAVMQQGAEEQKQAACVLDSNLSNKEHSHHLQHLKYEQNTTSWKRFWKQRVEIGKKGGPEDPAS